MIYKETENHSCASYFFRYLSKLWAIMLCLKLYYNSLANLETM